jgi:hypothetical protein
VLIGVDDVATGVGEKAADGGDQTGSIGAGEQQAGGEESVVDARMIAVEAAGSLSSLNPQFAIRA